MNTRFEPRWAALLALSLVCLPGAVAQGDAEFESVFDGRTLRGWHASAKTGHSGASGNRSGGKWVVEEGAIVGSQDIPGNGGILITDEQFGDFEVSLEMKNDFGPDSGLFLRSTEDGRAYQAMIDYHSGGNLMGIYGEGLDGQPSLMNFRFGDAPETITVSDAPTALPVSPADWPRFWRHGQWNRLRARITGNPPTIVTWINDVKFMEWTEPQKRHPDRGGIALQVHGGGDLTKQFVRYRNVRVKRLTGAENVLTAEEKAQGWLLLFDGRTLDGWMTSSGKPSQAPVEQESINPHKCGGYMMVHTQQWSNFALSLDFKISQGCNSGIFVRTASLTPRPGLDVGFNGIEIAIDDTRGAGYHDPGALYDLVKPLRNAMKPAGEWNQAVITCEGSLISVVLNGALVTVADLSEFVRPNERPDGTRHKFDVAYQNHPHLGYIGLQDHGSPCWFKNIKLRPLR